MNITLPITPQPWRRTRGNGKTRYTDTKTRAYKQEIKALFAPHMKGKKPYTGAIELYLDFFMPIPKSWSKKKKANPPDHISRPDLDNLVKAVKDALNGLAWKDDSQVIYLRSEKLYSDEPGISISITTWETKT